VIAELFNHISKNSSHDTDLSRVLLSSLLGWINFKSTGVGEKINKGKSHKVLEAEAEGGQRSPKRSAVTWLPVVKF